MRVQVSVIVSSDVCHYCDSVTVVKEVTSVVALVWCDVCHQMLKAENHLRSADVELQQRAVEYLQLSNVASIDVLVSFFVYAVSFVIDMFCP